MEKKLLELSAEYADLRSQALQEAEDNAYDEFREESAPIDQSRLDAIAMEYGATLKAFLLA
jgi:hypothetical protein